MPALGLLASLSRGCHTKGGSSQQSWSWTITLRTLLTDSRFYCTVSISAKPFRLVQLRSGAAHEILFSNDRKTASCQSGGSRHVEMSYAAHGCLSRRASRPGGRQTAGHSSGLAAHYPHELIPSHDAPPLVYAFSNHASRRPASSSLVLSVTDTRQSRTRGKPPD
ncbi:hypothetical protein LZ30DRAFT_122016 [Colletotrichum cereale]|nr:hypothetical protein LZ30DRAFT_122016 [Colletotrichum cereale]